MVRAVSLFSGSLASCLSTQILVDEPGIDDIILLTFRSPYFEKHDRVKGVAAQIWPSMNFRSKSIKRETEVIGRSGCNQKCSPNSDPFCVCCRISMLKSGRSFLDQIGADFLVTGEVLDKRGIGLRSMECIDEAAGTRGLVLRPLSAKLLPNTLPENKRWVDFELDMTVAEDRNLDRLVNKFGLDKSLTISSDDRCKLKESRYRRRLRDLLKESTFNANDLRLLDFDYYYKVGGETKVVLGTDGQEKYDLHDFFLPNDLRLYLPCHPGPMALVRSRWDSKSKTQVENIVDLAARITVANSTVEKKKKIPVNYRFEHEDGTYRTYVSPLAKGELEQFLI